MASSELEVTEQPASQPQPSRPSALSDPPQSCGCTRRRTVPRPLREEGSCGGLSPATAACHCGRTRDGPLSERCSCGCGGGCRSRSRDCVGRMNRGAGAGASPRAGWGGGCRCCCCCCPSFCCAHQSSRGPAEPGTVATPLSVPASRSSLSWSIQDEGGLTPSGGRRRASWPRAAVAHAGGAPRTG